MRPSALLMYDHIITHHQNVMMDGLVTTPDVVLLMEAAMMDGLILKGLDVEWEKMVLLSIILNALLKYMMYMI